MMMKDLKNPRNNSFDLKQRVVTLLFFISLSLVLGACQEAETKTDASIKELQGKQGIPVRVVLADSGRVADMRSFSGGVQGRLQKDIYPGAPEVIHRLRVQVGSYVKKGQVVATLEQEGVTPQFRQAKAQFETIRKTKERLEAVFAEGGISQQKLDEINAQYDAMAAAYDAARKVLEVEAPLSGVVTNIFAHEGEVAPFGKGAPPLLQVAQISKVLVKVKVPAQDIYLFKKGQRARTIVAGDTLWGSVFQVPLAADIMSRMFVVEIEFKNPAKKLRPGMFARVGVEVGADDGVVLPIEVLQEENNKYFAWVVENGVAHKNEVEAGLFGEERVLVRKGVKAGQQVVAQGMSFLKEGAKIQVVK
jgi:RND family efflux transporter MFP subunit